MAAARVVLSDHMSQLHSEEICFHRARMICDEKMHALNGNDISHYQSSQKFMKITKITKNVKNTQKCDECLIYKLFMIILTTLNDI